MGKTSKRLNAKRLLSSAEGLPDEAIGEPPTDAELWSGNAATSLAPMLAAGNPVESLFIAVAGHIKPGGRYETQRAAFSPAWLEFEDLFAAAVGKRRQLRMSARGRSGAELVKGSGGLDGTVTPPAAYGSDCDVSDGEVDQCAVDITPPKLSTPLVPFTSPELTEEQLKKDEQRKEVAMLETMIQDAQQKYESTIRQHLNKIQKDAVDLDSSQFPQLYANVRQWQDQLEPVLKDAEARPNFNMYNYSTKLLSKMSDLKKNDGETKTIPFSRLVHGQPKWEVCRRFLTALNLTNHGNTDIVYDGEEQRVNKFGVKLINSEAKQISFEDEEQPEMAALPPSGRPKKAVKKAVEPPADDGTQEEALAALGAAVGGGFVKRLRKGGADAVARAAASMEEAAAAGG